MADLGGRPHLDVRVARRRPLVRRRAAHRRGFRLRVPTPAEPEHGRQPRLLPLRHRGREGGECRRETASRLGRGSAGRSRLADSVGRTLPVSGRASHLSHRLSGAETCRRAVRRRLGETGQHGQQRRFRAGGLAAPRLRTRPQEPVLPCRRERAVGEGHLLSDGRPKRRLQPLPQRRVAHHRRLSAGRDRLAAAANAEPSASFAVALHDVPGLQRHRDAVRRSPRAAGVGVGDRPATPRRQSAAK